MKLQQSWSLALVAILAFGVQASAAPLLNEFEPNPAGGDPAETTFELTGDSGTDFDLWILSIENDGYNGTVDRAAEVSGTFDSNGLAVVTVPDLENPTFTVILTDNFEGSIGDDLDAADDGTLDVSSLGTILDAVAVSDNAGDDGTLYGAALGGTDILFNGEFEPLNVFREATTGDWYQTVTVDFGGMDEHIGVFAAGGGPEIDANLFTPDPTATTFGVQNPSLVPEPASMVMLLLASCMAAAASMRKRLG